MNLKYLYLPLVSFLTVASLNASIFFDDFDDETVGATPTGWSISNLVFVTSDYSVSPSNSFFFRDGANRTATLTNYVTIPDVSQDLAFSFDFFAGVASVESADSLVFYIDFGQGGGYQPVLKDAGVANGFAQTSDYTGTLITLANADGSATPGDFQSYSVIVPSSYYSDTLSADSFKLRYVWNGSSNDEDAYIDNISVAVVPEPSQFAILLGLGALLVACKRRRA